MISTNETVVSIFQVGLQRYDGLLRHIFDLLEQIFDIVPLGLQRLYDRRKQLLG